MVEIAVLSSDDIRFLRELKREHEKRDHSRQTLTKNQPTESAQSKYLVEIPEGEVIPAKITSIVDSLTCYVVRLDRSNNTLVRTGQTLQIFNSSSSDLFGYALAKRDAFGTWWADIGESGAGAEIIRFTITGQVSDPALGTRSANASLDEVICGGSEFSSLIQTGTGTGSEAIVVTDVLGCWFRELSEEFLTGLEGYAVRMNSTLSGTGAESCGWEVLSLCYPDNCFIPGIDPEDIPIGMANTGTGTGDLEYVLGIDATGCLVKIGTTSCPVDTGTA